MHSAPPDGLYVTLPFSCGTKSSDPGLRQHGNFVLGGRACTLGTARPSQPLADELSCFVKQIHTEKQICFNFYASFLSQSVED